MFSFSDLFQWDRFITPTIIKTFYWLVIALICLFGLSGIFSGLATMAISPFGGFLVLLSSIASIVVGIVFSRIAAELILIVFRINEHLGAIRDQGGVLLGNDCRLLIFGKRFGFGLNGGLSICPDGQCNVSRLPEGARYTSAT